VTIMIEIKYKNDKVVYENYIKVLVLALSLL